MDAQKNKGFERPAEKLMMLGFFGLLQIKA
jgi:hypothetical protein